ncbi:MAG: hypothetical protein IPH37_06770 [Burkholderiales bacterium]|nr:hypothetical protein [Burkholderiales bacterium]
MSTTAPTNTSTPTPYAPTPWRSTSPSSMPTMASKGTAANHAPTAVSSTTGQGRSLPVGTVAWAWALAWALSSAAVACGVVICGLR